ncbi:MAG: MBL fold metallo-hydrolase [Candidatus Latescibacteria bacterium]|nr:MBL fold metallo-hydrolase [Candidatus Latescibacterota bacterium]
MLFRQFYIDGLAQISYMVGNRAPGAVAVIDPIRDIDLYLDTARQEGVRITHIFETHIHADFVSGARELAARTGAAMCLSAEGGPDWQYQFDHLPLHDGTTIDIGQYRFAAWHTPGHTPEHLMFTVADLSRSPEPWMAFTGDFLFVGDVGRPDLLGEAAAAGLAEALYDSIHAKLLTLNDGVEVYPGHGEGSLCGRNLGSKRSTTIGYERRFNYALQPMPKDAFVRLILEGQPPAPPYFRRMKRMNREGPRVLGGVPEPKGLSATEVKASLNEGAVVLDARRPEAFGGAHIPDAFNIPLDKLFATWVGYVVPADQAVILLLDGPAQLNETIRQLIRVGYDAIAGYVDGGMTAWEMNGYPVTSLPQLSAQDLRSRVERGEPLVVLDVRTDSEWLAERYPYALHVHAGYVTDGLQKYAGEAGGSIDPDRPIAVMCRSGHRASIAASILQRQGYRQVFNVPGGIVAWKHIGGLVCSEPGCPDYRPWQPWWGDAKDPAFRLSDRLGIGGQLTEADFDLIKARGYKTVVNLRSPQERSPLPFALEEARVRELGMEYVSLPVTRETLTTETVDRLSGLVQRDDRAPVFVHCASGRRSGALAILHLAVEHGWTAEQTFERARNLGFECESDAHLRAFMREYLEGKRIVVSGQ